MSNEHNSKTYNLRHITISAVFIAMGVLLPMLFHSVPRGGNIFLPMHLPAMLAAFFLPTGFAMAIGFITPLLSSLLTGMPPLAPLPMAIIMAFEIAAYAGVISMMRKLVYRRKKYFAPLLAVVPAMIVGRAVAGLVVFVLTTAVGIKMASPLPFIWGSITGGIIGIAIQIVVIPPLYGVLVKILPGWNGQEYFFEHTELTQVKNSTIS